MATVPDAEFFPTTHNAEGLLVLNERCIVRTENEHRVVIVGGVVLAQYALNDAMAQAHAMVSLVEQGWADQNDVARVFGCSVRTLRRHQRRFEEGGLAALGHRGGFPRGRRRVAAQRRRLVARGGVKMG